MKKFIIYIGIIVGITLGVAMLLEKGYYAHYKKYPAKTKVESMLQLKNKHYDVVFLGSSRTERHIDCEMITRLTGKSCANFGFSGLQLMDSDVLLSFFEMNNVTFDDVFIQVDYSYGNQKHSPLFKSALVPYLQLDFVKESLNESSEDLWSLNIPFVGYMVNDLRYSMRVIAADLAFNKPQEIYTYDIKPVEGENTNVVAGFPKEFIVGHPSVERFIHSEKFKNGNMHLFTSPYCPQVPNRAYHTQLVEEFPFIKDYTALYDNNLELYKDCGHLNINGARTFTNFFVKDNNL